MRGSTVSSFLPALSQTMSLWPVLLIFLPTHLAIARILILRQVQRPMLMGSVAHPRYTCSPCTNRSCGCKRHLQHQPIPAPSDEWLLPRHLKIEYQLDSCLDRFELFIQRHLAGTLLTSSTHPQRLSLNTHSQVPSFRALPAADLLAVCTSPLYTCLWRCIIRSRRRGWSPCHRP